MMLRDYRLIAEVTGQRPLAIYKALREFGERPGKPIESPLFVLAYVATELQNRIELPSGNERHDTAEIKSGN